MCEILATGSHPQDDVNPKTLQGKDVNRRMVFAAFESGIGKEGVAKFCEVFNMLFNMSPDTWYSHEETLVKPSQRIDTSEQLQKNCAEARRIQQAEHRAQEKHKQYRLTQRQAKQREENLLVTREGITYEAGGFDETQLYRVGKKRKNKKNLSIPSSRCAVMHKRPF